MAMAEHEKKALEIQREIYRRMTPEEKLRIAFKMNLEARELKAAWLKQQHPDWSQEQIDNKVREIFLHARTY